jgi:ubiquitin-protein ligase E3 C
LKAQKIIRVCGIFTQEILSVPVLVSRWNSWGMNSIIDNLTNTETWEWILESSLKFDFKFPTSKDRHCVVPSQIIGGDARTIGEYPPIGCLVANLLDLSYKSSFVRMSSKFISAMSILLKRADEMIFPNLSVSNDDDEEDDDNEYDEKEMYISKKINQVDDEISLQLNIFGDEKFIEILSNSLFDSEDTNLSFIVSSLLHSLFIKWPSISDKILNNLVLGTQIIRHMWFSLVKSKQLESLFTSVVNIPESVLISFSLFCQSYSFFLSIADDKSLHDGSRGFGVEDQLSIIAFLKRFLFEYCWNRIEDSKRLDREYRIIQFASQTFKNLHERDSRWQFVPIDSWTMKKISLSTFEVEFSRRISRSINLMETMPFVIPFAQRVKLFYDLIVKDQESIDDFSFRSLQSFKIRRSHLVEDAFEQMYSLRSGFKDRVKIEFISEQGFVEAGIDGGGLFKEFLTSLGSIAFSPEFGIFKETDEHFLYPNPLSSQIRYDHLSFFTFLGMIVGKALYENIIIEPRFANFFLRKMLGKENYADDLVSYDPVLYKNLMSVKDFSGKELADLHLNFMITTEDNKNIELISKGSNISVNDENKLLFIREVANFKLNRQVSNQSHAFLNGLSSIIDRSWIKMFSAPELQLLISGSTSIDIQDWANHTTYTAGYHEHSPQVIWFWEIVRESSEEDRKSILKFCTSCSRAPLLGFKAMNPNFAIQKISGSIDSLPTTATCVNLLKLPEYPSKSTMSAKLLYAARSNSGFELT